MSDASNPSQSGAPVGAQALPQALGGAPVAPAATPPATPPAAPAAGQPPAGVVTPAKPADGVLLADPAPATPPAPNPDTSDEFSYDPTGDAGLDYALNFVGKLGYGDTHPAIQAAQVRQVKRKAGAVVDAQQQPRHSAAAARVPVLARRLEQPPHSIQFLGIELRQQPAHRGLAEAQAARRGGGRAELDDLVECFQRLDVVEFHG